MPWHSRATRHAGELRERRTGERIERAIAVAAFIATQIACTARVPKFVDLQWPHAGDASNRVSISRIASLAEPAPQRRNQAGTLHLGQFTELFDKRPEILGFHGILGDKDEITTEPSLYIKSKPRDLVREIRKCLIICE